MHKNDENGFVSIIVASTIMIIITLVTIGFTQIMQREQRQSLDRQLSRQALYAAESGINDMYQQLLTDTSLPTKKSQCTPNRTDGGSPISINPVVSASNGIEYTCILYDKQPRKLEKTPSPSESWVIRLTSASGDDFNSITISWRNADDTNNNASNLANSATERACNGDFPSSRTNSIPVLKVDLTNIQGAISRANLVNGSEYLYLVPCADGTSGTNSHSFDSATRGDVVIVNCTGVTGTNFCSLTINNLSGLSSENFLARIRPIYTSAQVEITGTVVGVQPAPARFDGQFSIDVTAKASDVVRRLRAAVPIGTVEQPPEAVLQSFNGVCKLLDVNSSTGSVVSYPC